MPTIVQFRRGTTAENDNFTGAVGELSIDTTLDVIRVHDGATQGGFPLAGTTASQTLTNKTLSSPTFTGTLTGNLIPSANVTYNLGNATNSWNDLYLAGNTIYLGPLQLQALDGNTFVIYKSDGTTQANIDVGSIDVSSINSGTSAIGISVPNGNAYVTVGGAANVLVITSTGANITGTLNATGNANVGNLGATNAVLAGSLTGVTTISASGNANVGNIGGTRAVFTNVVGTLETAAQTNVTSLGTLTGLTLSGTLTGTTINAATIGNAGATVTAATVNAATIGNAGATVTAATVNAATIGNSGATLTGTLSTAAQPNITSVGSLTSLTVTGNITTTAGNVTAGNLTVNTDTVITGNLTVNGTTTTLNSQTLTVNDKTIVVANNQSTGATVDGSGIDAGGGTPIATWRYNNATTSWQSNIAITPSANGTLQLGGTSNYWGATYVTTLTASGNANVGNIGATAAVFTGTLTGATINAATIGNAGATVTAATVNAATIGNSGALLTGTLTTAAQPNVTSVGSLTSLTVTGNANVGNLGTSGLITATGNISATGNVSGSYFIGNGSLLTGIDATAIQNGTANVRTFLNGNVTISAAGVANVLVVTSTGANIAGTLNATGNANVGNIGATNAVFTGTLTGATINAATIGNTGAAFTGASISAATIGNAGASLTGTLQTAAQTNVTSLGTLTGLTLSGTLTGTTINAATIGNAGASLTGTLQTAAQTNVTSLGTLTGLTLVANGNITMSGSLSTLSGANLVSATNLTGTLTTAAQPNVTSLGTLTSLAVSGNLSATTAAGNTNTTTVATTAFVVGQAGGATPGAVGSASIGTSLRYAREDHTHSGVTSVNGSTGAVTSIATTTGNLSQFASTTSAQLAGVISDETGSGSLVFATSPTLVTPTLGVASATSINKVTITAPATSATLTIADGKTLTASNSLTFTGTDASSVAFGTGGTVAYQGGTLAQFASTTSAQLAGVISDETGSGSLVFATSPTLAGTPLASNAAANTNTAQIATTAFVVGQAGGATPGAVGSASIGTSLKYAREDHTHSGVTSTAAGTGISVSASTGAVTITNSGVTSAVAGTGISVSGATGAVTITNSGVTSVNGSTGAVTGIATTGATLAQFAATTSAQLAGVISDETGSGSLVFATSPTLTTPNIGAATGTSLNISTGTLTCGGIVNANANGVGNIGSSTTYFNTVFAKATSAQYADLAEMYVADADYEPGTVVSFGGDHEITMSRVSSDTRIAGVVSTNPSYLMNATCVGEHTLPVALVGRVPTWVSGPVRKGDMMVSDGHGRAQASAAPSMGTVIGKALEDFDGNVGIIEIVIGRL